MPFQTETVYGLGANALDEKAAAKDLCGPREDHLIILWIVHIARLEDLYEVAEHVPEKAETLARKFWPGPLTMIFEKTSIVPYGTTGGTGDSCRSYGRMMRLQEH